MYLVLVVKTMWYTTLQNPRNVVSDMARYIEANELVRKMTLQAKRTMFGEIAPPQLSYSEMLEIIADAPNADVVPKSEVERLQIELDAMRGAANSYKRHYDNLAREIFEDIEREIKNHGITYAQRKIAELKKKYTEL